MLTMTVLESLESRTLFITTGTFQGWTDAINEWKQRHPIAALTQDFRVEVLSPIRVRIVPTVLKWIDAT